MTMPRYVAPGLLVAVVFGAGSARAQSAVETASPASGSKDAFAHRLLLGMGYASTHDRDGVRHTFTPRFDLQFRVAPRWRLDATWNLAALSSPTGNITDRRTGEIRADTVPRTGNPTAWGRYALMREPSGFDVDLALGFAFPMASIEQPTPETGPDFDRAAHTEASYRRALAATGFRRPWELFWSTASVLGSAYVRQTTGPVVTDIDLTLGVLLPAGRLRKEVGFVGTVSAYAGVQLGVAEIGMRTDLGYSTVQRDDFDNSLQLRGVQWSFSPEFSMRFQQVLLRALVVVGAGVDIEPFPERAVWGSHFQVGYVFE